MDLISFLNLRKSMVDTADKEGLASVETEALARTREFLNGEIAADTNTAPLFYSFFRTFSQTENADLKTACETAVEKIRPYLDDFDKENGLTRLDDLSKNVLEHNLAALSVFEQLNPFELKKENLLKFQAFSDLFRLTSNIEITDDTGRVSEQAHTNFVNTLIDGARLQTFMTLSVSEDKITEDVYLDNLRQNMEIGLVSMFVVDHVPDDHPITDETKNQIQTEYQKLLNAI